MKEIEVKVIEVNKEEMIEKLINLGAKKVFEGTLSGNWYKNTKNVLLRLRKEGPKTFLTMKKKISKDKAKVMEELETEVKEFEIMHEILANFFEFNAMPKKQRIKYKLKDTSFDFDEYEGIPVFMEIEAGSIEKIEEYIRKLNIDQSNVKNWTGKELLEHYKK